MRFLFKRGERASKRAFWQAMTMIPATAFLYVVVFRFYNLPDELFVEGIVKAGIFLGVIEGIILYWYHKGGKGNGNGEGDP
jgi:hypothetical protein